MKTWTDEFGTIAGATEGELTNAEWSNLRVLQRKTVYCL